MQRNVEFGGKERAADLLERLGIARLATARPHQLSGGERQRVALARALAREPRVLLLDEPLSALDPHTRDSVREELAGHLLGFGLPTLLVTHDAADAIALADRVGVLRDGRIVQLGNAGRAPGRARPTRSSRASSARLTSRRLPSMLPVLIVDRRRRCSS